VTFKVFTDGGCHPNPGPGGWGAIIVLPDGHERVLKGHDVATTNNRMELQGPIEALRYIHENFFEGVRLQIEVTTDSQYVRNGITGWVRSWKRNGWRTSTGGLVKNREQWEELDRLQQLHKVTFHWTRGHAGHHYNERCDELATEGRLAAMSLVAKDFL